MPKKPHESSHGDVVPQLKDLLEVARTTWEISVTKRMVAQAARLNVKTVNDLFDQKTTLYDLQTLWKLCWFFQCGIGDLLLWIPPEKSPYSVQLSRGVQVGPITLPRKHPPEKRFIRNVIPARLEGTKRGEVAAKSDLAENTVAALLNQTDPPTRIARATLAALCHYLSQREGYAVPVGELLVYEDPATAQEDRP